MASVPTWVYLLFLALLYLGIRRCFTTVVKVKQLVILPAALAWLSLDGLWRSLSLTYHSLWSYFIGFIIGFGLGFLQLRNVQIRGDKSQNLIEIPGDWMYLTFILVFFIIEFIINYAIAVTPSIAHMALLVALILFVSGFLVGIAFGRNGCYLYKFMHTNHISLPPPTKTKTLFK